RFVSPGRGVSEASGLVELRPEHGTERAGVARFVHGRPGGTDRFSLRVQRQIPPGLFAAGILAVELCDEAVSERGTYLRIEPRPAARLSSHFALRSGGFSC